MSKETKTLDKHEQGNDFIADVSNRTFTETSQDVAERLHNFMDKHQLAKIGTFNKKLRMLVADILNEYGC